MNTPQVNMAPGGDAPVLQTQVEERYRGGTRALASTRGRTATGIAVLESGDNVSGKSQTYFRNPWCGAAQPKQLWDRRMREIKEARGMVVATPLGREHDYIEYKVDTLLKKLSPRISESAHSVIHPKPYIGSYFKRHPTSCYQGEATPFEVLGRQMFEVGRYGFFGHDAVVGTALMTAGDTFLKLSAEERQLASDVSNDLIISLDEVVSGPLAADVKRKRAELYNSRLDMDIAKEKEDVPMTPDGRRVQEQEVTALTESFHSVSQDCQLVMLKLSDVVESILSKGSEALVQSEIDYHSECVKILSQLDNYIADITTEQNNHSPAF